MFKANYLSALLLITLAACGSKTTQKDPVTNAETTENKKVDETAIVSFDSKVEFEVKYKRAVELGDLTSISDFAIGANHFEIYINTKNNAQLNDGKVKCYNTNKKTDKQELLATNNLRDGKRVIIPINLSNADSFENKVSCIVIDNDKIITKPIDHTFYKDLVITTETNFNDIVPGLNSGNNKIGALIITKSGTLVTRGNNIRIEASDLVLEEGSLIQTFRRTDLESPANEDGKSGGIIEINSRNSIGYLKAEMRGRNAGYQYRAQIDRTELPNVPQVIKNINANECREASEGARGLKGFQGLPGNNGGDSGQLILNIGPGFMKLMIENDSVTYEPGLGGQGGHGGYGGPGGIGALVNYTYSVDSGFDSSCSRHCTAHTTKETKSCVGPNGPMGESGDVGVYGQNGKIQEKIITIK
jgi:hypothetical protein